MPSIQAAEATRKSRPKSLDHIEIHPRMGGGHVVKHVYTSYEHEPKEHNFGEDGYRDGKGGGEHIANHLAKHAGLPVAAAGEEQEPEGEGEAEE